MHTHDMGPTHDCQWTTWVYLHVITRHICAVYWCIYTYTHLTTRHFNNIYRCVVCCSSLYLQKHCIYWCNAYAFYGWCIYLIFVYPPRNSWILHLKPQHVSQDTSLECHRGHFYVQDQVGEGAFFGMDVMRLGCAAHGVYTWYTYRERERERDIVFSYDVHV